jgi:hypothetical protein
MQLSNHFTLEELTNSSTALRLRIDNSASVEIQEHLAELAKGLELVRDLLGNPMHIDSGYRCHELNAAVKGATASAHLDGYAADFTCEAFGTPLEIVHALVASKIQFDKCIQEGTWVHISFAPTMRRMLLTAHFGPEGTTYTSGV